MPSKPSPSPRDKQLTELVYQTGRHMGCSRLLRLASHHLDRDEVADLMSLLGRVDLEMALYRNLFNNNDPHPCPDAFADVFREGFLRGCRDAVVHRCPHFLTTTFLHVRVVGPYPSAFALSSISLHRSMSESNGSSSSSSIPMATMAA